MSNNGWIKPVNFPKHHYFVDGKSLCEGIGIGGSDNATEIMPGFSVRCKKCTRLYMARNGAKK